MSRDRCDFQRKKLKHNANRQHTNTHKLARSRIVFGSGSRRSRDLGYDIMGYYNSSRWSEGGWDSGGGCIEHRVCDIQRVPPLARCTIDRRGGSGGNGGGRGVAKNARNVFTPTTAAASTLLPVTTTITTTLLPRYMYTIPLPLLPPLTPLLLPVCRAALHTPESSRRVQSLSLSLSSSSCPSKFVGNFRFRFYIETQERGFFF